MYGVKSQAGKLRYLGISSRPACFPNTVSQGAQYGPEAFTPARSGTENDMHLTDYNLPYKIYDYNNSPPTSIQEPERLFGFDILSKEDGSHVGYLVCEAVHGTHGATGYYFDIRWAKFIGDTRVDTFPFPNTHIWWEVDGTHADAVNLTAGFFLDEVDGKEILGVNFTHVSGVYGPNDSGYFNRDCSSWIFTKEGTLLLDPETETLNYEETDDPNDADQDGNSRPGGGDNGTHDHHSDVIEPGNLTELNNICAANAGLVTLYKITLAQLNDLANELYSDSIWDIVKNWWNKPYDMIAGLMLLPVTPRSGAVYKPKVGTHTFNISLPVVANQYIEVDMGGILLKPYYDSCLDFAPYTQIQLYLPMIGMRELNVDEVMRGFIRVKYRIDCYNGDCIAFVYVGDDKGRDMSVKYTFPGNCGQQIPVSAADFSAVITGAIQFATVATASIISAGTAAGVASAANSAALTAGEEVGTSAGMAAAQSMASSAGVLGASAANLALNGKPRVERAGNIGCSMGQMGILRPFVVWTIPRQCLPDHYSSFEGYPLNMYSRLSFMSGYTVVDSIRLNGVPGTESELVELESILKGGVYL